MSITDGKLRELDDVGSWFWVGSHADYDKISVQFASVPKPVSNVQNYSGVISISYNLRYD